MAGRNRALIIRYTKVKPRHWWEKPIGTGIYLFDVPAETPSATAEFGSASGRVSATEQKGTYYLLATGRSQGDVDEVVRQLRAAVGCPEPEPVIPVPLEVQAFRLLSQYRG